MEFTKEDLTTAKEIQDHQHSDREINMPSMSIRTWLR